MGKNIYLAPSGFDYFTVENMNIAKCGGKVQDGKLSWTFSEAKQCGFEIIRSLYLGQ